MRHATSFFITMLCVGLYISSCKPRSTTYLKSTTSEADLDGILDRIDTNIVLAQDKLNDVALSEAYNSSMGDPELENQIVQTDISGSLGASTIDGATYGLTESQKESHQEGSILLKRIQRQIEAKETVRLEIIEMEKTVTLLVESHEKLMKDFEETLGTKPSNQDAEESIKFRQIQLKLAQQNLSMAKAAYEQAEENFKLLNERLKVLELKLENFETKVTQELAALDKKISTIPIITPNDIEAGIRYQLDKIASESNSGQNQESLDSAFFHHPRIEVRHTQISEWQMHAAVGLDFPPDYSGLVAGTVRAGINIIHRYAVDTHIAAQELRPLLTATGNLNRDASIMCSVYEIHTVSPNVHAGIRAPIGDLGGGYTQTEETEPRRYSKIINVKAGETFQQQIGRCHQFRKYVEEVAPISPEFDGARYRFQAQKVQCVRDQDCRHMLAKTFPGIKATTISECRYDANYKRNMCSGPRQLEGFGAECRPAKNTKFVYGCAKGLICSTNARCVFPGQDGTPPPTTLGQQPLPGTVVRDAKAVLRANHIDRVRHMGYFSAEDFAEVRKQLDYCEKQVAPGWRLSKRTDLFALSVYDREFFRNDLRKSSRSNASEWYYNNKSNQGIIWSRDHFAWIKATDSAAPIIVSSPQSVARFTPKNGPTRVVRGALYCVKPMPGVPEEKPVMINPFTYL